MSEADRVALIFNAGEPAVARCLAAGGARVVLHNPPAELIEVLDRHDDNLLVLDADLTLPSAHEDLVAQTLQRFRLDAAWIRTGVTVGVYSRFLRSDDRLWDIVKLHNLDMVMSALRAVLPSW